MKISEILYDFNQPHYVYVHANVAEESCRGCWYLTGNKILYIYPLPKSRGFFIYERYKRNSQGEDSYS